MLSSDPAARAAGNLAQRLGDRSEKKVAGMHAMYRRDGQAVIDKQNIATRGGKTGRIVCGRARIDFAGQLNGGRAVAIELKCTGTEGTSLAIGERGIQRDQIEELALRGRMGALALILWVNGDKLGWMSWRDAEAHAATRASLPASGFTWLAPLEFDWLASVRARGGVL